jgi:hypothetical protein
MFYLKRTFKIFIRFFGQIQILTAAVSGRSDALVANEREPARFGQLVAHTHQ